MPSYLLFHKLSYLGLFLLLSGAGIFSPIPEEIILLTGGYLSANNLMNPWFAIPISILGTLSGDALLFFLVKSGSRFTKKMRARVQRLSLESAWLFSPKHPLRTVFFMRFVTGLRMISPIYAGFHEVPWLEFLRTSLFALVIFVPTIFGIGYYFNESITHFIHGFELVRHLLFIGLLVVVFIAMIATLYHYSPHAKRRREEKLEEEALEGYPQVPPVLPSEE